MTIDNEKKITNNAVFFFEITYNFDLGDTITYALSIRETFQECFLQLGVDKYVYQLELGKLNGRLHFQGIIHVLVRKREEQLNKLFKSLTLNEGLKGARIKRSSTAGINSLKRYCMKDETRIAGAWADKEIYLGEDLPHTLLPWQLALKEYILSPVNGREIIWVIGHGNDGKSTFAKYMCYYHKCLLLSYGKAGDLLNLVSKEQNRKCYIFDLTRVKPNSFSNEDLYASIEEIKKGHFINLKYETSQIIMRKPHIIIFANHAPCTSNLTGDMWNILRLPEDCNIQNKKPKRMFSSDYFVKYIDTEKID